MAKKKEKKDKPFLICSSCRAEVTQGVVVSNIHTWGGCPTCGYGEGFSADIEITCPSCKAVLLSYSYNSNKE